jgi:HEAT repeat protein
VYGTYQQASASERISAVNLSANVPEEAEALSREISEILIYTMNNDQNVNVRQAAAEALFRFRNEPEIRRALVQSLSQQTDPLMQLTLIDMLVDLKERSAINEMQKLLMDSDTREVVKNRLKVSIAELKT